MAGMRRQGLEEPNYEKMLESIGSVVEKGHANVPKMTAVKSLNHTMMKRGHTFCDAMIDQSVKSNLNFVDCKYDILCNNDEITLSLLDSKKRKRNWQFGENENNNGNNMNGSNDIGNGESNDYDILNDLIPENMIQNSLTKAEKRKLMESGQLNEDFVDLIAKRRELHPKYNDPSLNELETPFIQSKSNEFLDCIHFVNLESEKEKSMHFVKWQSCVDKLKMTRKDLIVNDELKYINRKKIKHFLKSKANLGDKKIDVIMSHALTDYIRNVLQATMEERNMRVNELKKMNENYNNFGQLYHYGLNVQSWINKENKIGNDKYERGLKLDSRHALERELNKLNDKNLCGTLTKEENNRRKKLESLLFKNNNNNQNSGNQNNNNNNEKNNNGNDRMMDKNRSKMLKKIESENQKDRETEMLAMGGDFTFHFKKKKKTQEKEKKLENENNDNSNSNENSNNNNNNNNDNNRSNSKSKYNKDDSKNDSDNDIINDEKRNLIYRSKNDNIRDIDLVNAIKNDEKLLGNHYSLLQQWMIRHKRF